MIGGDFSSTFGYRGRLGRGQFWAGMTMVLAVAVMTTGALATALDPASSGTGIVVLTAALIPLFFWLFSLVAIRRLHDRDMSGWWFLPFGALPVLLTASSLSDGRLLPQLGSLSGLLQLAAVILAGFGLLTLGFGHGTPGMNRFGPPPWGTHRS
jgi:uncharacterized membrane protein YhaH (DUF805 family)